jgi:threonine dehydratase
VVAIGGGGHATGAIVVARSLHPELPVYGVQAANAPAIHDAWHAGQPLPGRVIPTIADGLATRSCYELTFPALQQGLRDFVTVSEAEIAEALRVLLRTTHNLVEGAGGASLAGVRKLAGALAGKTVAVFLTGGNIDEGTLRAVVSRQV